MTLLLTLLALLTLTTAERASTPLDVAITVHAAHAIAPRYGVDPLDLLAIAWVESRYIRTAGCAHPGRGCGIYQQVPRWSGMLGDDCWDGADLTCRQPGGEGVAAEELLDVYRATETAARAMRLLQSRYGAEWVGAYNRGGLRRNDAAGREYARRVDRIRRRIER